MSGTSRPNRVLLYSHDSYGLGHVSRCRTIANAIVDLLQSPDKRRNLGEAARARALRHFTEQIFAEGYRDAYRDLASRKLPQLAHAS